MFSKCAVEITPQTEAKRRIKEAAAHLAKYARLGSYFKVSWDAKEEGKIEPIQVNADKIRRIFDLNQLVGTHGQDGIDQGDEDLLEYEPQSTNPIYKFIDILLGGTTDTGLDGYVTKFKALLVPFIRFMFIMHIDSELEMDKASNTRPKAVKFQGYADDCFARFVELFGDEGMSNYWHCYGSGHFYELMHLWGNLVRFRNEGAEALNLDLKMRFLKHTQRGGSKGWGASRTTGDKAGGLGWWLMRRYIWLTGLAWDALGKTWDAEVYVCG
jgi:hypothetical protein